MLLLQGITKPPSSSNFPCIQFVLLCLLCPLKYLQGETCSLIDLAPADLFFASSCMCVLSISGVILAPTQGCPAPAVAGAQVGRVKS